MTESSFFYRLNAKIQNILGYGQFLRRNLSGFLPLDPDFSVNISVKDINQLLTGYPNNHNYKIYKKKLLPSFQLYERLKLVTSLYPEGLESFLDIGCCKGFFVLDAAQRSHCQISAGIDVYEPFISISKKVKKYLNIKNADFYLATLDEVSNRPEAYGGPFQTVLLIGTYHYLFWGSRLCPRAYINHREILSRLSQICTNRLIFSARLEVNSLPINIKERVKMPGIECTYNTVHFLKSAREFFEVRKAGYLGKYPLFVMSKKNF